MRTPRRDFLKSTLAASGLVTFGAPTIPGFLGRSARAAARAEKANDRVLVVIQLLGGNDGLNTVVPHGLDGYANARRALRLPTSRLHKLTKEIGLHPSLGGLAKLVDQGRASVVQGVGYPNPDRSHFRSMEIWESARMEPGAVETGWVGRALDAMPARPGGDVPAMHVGGRGLPIALRARRGEVPTIESLDDYRLHLEGDAAGRREARDTIDGLARLDRGDDPLLGFLRRSCRRRLRVEPAPGGDRPRQIRQGLELSGDGAGEAAWDGRQAHQGGLRHDHLLHRARRVRHPRPPARHARGAPVRASPTRSPPSTPTCRRRGRPTGSRC